MRWRRNDNQKMADRRRAAYKERISGERKREHYNLSPWVETEEQELKEGARGMIKVTRLSDEILYLNIFQIESIESIPETKIKMMNGYYYLVKDSEDSILEQMKGFFRSCFVLDDKSEGQ